MRSRAKAAVLLLAIAIAAAFFFVPVVHTTVPPPTYHPNCVHCAPYIAESVEGSITYQVFGYGGIIPGDWTNWRYYSVYFG